jgi:FixJ family two-component response regulator
MHSSAGTVFMVGYAPELGAVISRILALAGYEVHSFESAERFLQGQNCEIPGCLLLDIRMPGMGGIYLQRALLDSPSMRPIVFLTGHGDIRTSVEAMKAGAIDFLIPPVDGTRLLAAVAQGVRLDAADRGERAIRGVIKHCLETLTPRETQVMKGILRGRLNKQIAAELGIAHKTTKRHRLRVMSKLRVRSVANLVHLVGRVGITVEPLRTSGAVALKLDAKPALHEKQKYSKFASPSLWSHGPHPATSLTSKMALSRDRREALT